MLRRLLPLIALLSIAPNPLPAQQPVTAIVRRASASVVVLRRFDSGGREAGFGSGFIMPDGRVATNYHVVAGAKYIEVQDGAGQLLGSFPFAEVISRTSDLAILPRLPGARPGLRLSASPAEVGERILVMGAPEGLSSTVSDGLVSSYRALNGRQLMQISAPISPGSSGGPVLSSAGEVVGISVSQLVEGQNLNFAVPVATLRVLAGSPAGRIDLAAAQPNDSAEPSRAGVGRGSVSHLTLGTPIQGRLERSDPLLTDKSHYDEYAYYGHKGEVLVVRMSSAAFDTYLSISAVVGDEYREIATDDDGAGGTDSRIQLTIPNEGIFVIRANSLEPGALGAYTLEAAGATTSSAMRGAATAELRHFTFRATGCGYAPQAIACALSVENRGDSTANRHIYVDDVFLVDASGQRTRAPYLIDGERRWNLPGAFRMWDRLARAGTPLNVTVFFPRLAAVPTRMEIVTSIGFAGSNQTIVIDGIPTR